MVRSSQAAACMALGCATALATLLAVEASCAPSGDTRYCTSCPVEPIAKQVTATTTSRLFHIMSSLETVIYHRGESARRIVPTPGAAVPGGRDCGRGRRSPVQRPAASVRT